ncbi:MAG TPA: ECF transporter S component, partial [Candidatus Agathobaculum pullistercoris]|nr:ECF transporter S component [Candidatus Agathobaculum pullistercoris]
MKSKTFNIRSMTQLALLTAITLVLAYTPIGYLPLGPFNVSFLSVPVCIGAVVMGPGVGAFLGLVFGLTSFGNALSGGSVMGVALMSVSPVGYFVQSVVGRVLMGLCTGLIFRAVRKVDRRGFASYVVGAVSAPLLNTVFYMGLMCLIFYNCEYVQNLVASTGAANPILLVLAVVGVQGVIEVLVCGVIGSVISKAVDAALGRRAAERPSSVPAEALAEGANGYLPHAEPAAAEEQEVTVVMPVPDKT